MYKIIVFVCLYYDSCTVQRMTVEIHFVLTVHTWFLPQLKGAIIIYRANTS